MSRKHYRAVAAAIALISDAEERRKVALLVAEAVGPLNPEFKRSTFLAACGVGGY